MDPCPLEPSLLPGLFPTTLECSSLHSEYARITYTLRYRSKAIQNVLVHWNAN